MFRWLIIWITCVHLIGQLSAGVTADSSRKLNELLETYDSRVRPYADEKPVEVKLQISILDLGPIDEKDFTFRIDIYFRTWWTDPRLKLEIGNVTFNGNPSYIWIPDLFMTNSKSIHMHSSTTETIRTIVNYDGSIFMSARISAICACKMDLHAYPMDNQTCGIVIESYAFSGKDLALSWHEVPVEYIPDDMQVEGYEVKNICSLNGKANYTGDSFQQLRVHFKIKRTFSHYLYRSYVPSSSLVIMTWGSFWLPVTSYPARTGLIVTNFLASAFILQESSAHIIKVPYTTAMEIFLLVNIIFILAAMLEFFVVIQIPLCGCSMLKRCFKRDKIYNVGVVTQDQCANCEEKHNHGDNRDNRDKTTNTSIGVPLLDRASRYAFPLVYAVFIISYYTYYVNLTNSLF